MIISRWHGFEIDSSEGYYSFEEDIPDLKEGFVFLDKLLGSPLLWKWISFALVPLEGQAGYIREYLSDKKDQGLVIEIIEEGLSRREAEKAKAEYEYPRDYSDGLPPSHRDPDYMATGTDFRAILEDLKEKVMLVSVNFLFKDLKKLPRKEYYNFREWFMKQYDDEKKAEFYWQNFESSEFSMNPPDQALARGRASADDQFIITGISDYSDSHDKVDPLEGSFELYCKLPYSYRLLADPNDPSFIIYLASTLLDTYAFELQGRNSCDNSPPLLELKKGV